MNNYEVWIIGKLQMTGLFAALSLYLFTFSKLKSSCRSEDATSIHLGNAICVLRARLWRAYGGSGGAIGMTIGEFFDPVYAILHRRYLTSSYRPNYRVSLVHCDVKINDSHDSKL